MSQDITVSITAKTEEGLQKLVSIVPAGIPILQESDWLPDWFFLGADSDGGEGTWAEWNSIIKAILEQRSHRAGRRLAITHYENHIKLYSPRNCQGPDDCIRINREDLSNWIRVTQTILNANAHTSNPPQS